MPFGVLTLEVHSKKPCIRWGAHWRHLVNTILPSVCDCDAALCRMTLTTCCYYYFETDWHKLWAMKIEPKQNTDGINIDCVGLLGFSVSHKASVQQWTLTDRRLCQRTAGEDRTAEWEFEAGFDYWFCPVGTLADNGRRSFRSWRHLLHPTQVPKHGRKLRSLTRPEKSHLILILCRLNPDEKDGIPFVSCRIPAFLFWNNWWKTSQGGLFGFGYLENGHW